MKRNDRPRNTDPAPVDGQRTNARGRSILGSARHGAMAALAMSALLAHQSSAQNTYQIGSGSCGGCNICLGLNGAGPNPIRAAESCSSAAGCFSTDPYPLRFNDLTSHRGVLQIASRSWDVTGCPQTLSGIAKWDTTNTPAGADVYFTGPVGASSVSTRVRYRVSTAATGDATFGFSGRFQNYWGSDISVPPNATEFEIVSPLTDIGLNFWRSCGALIQTYAINGTACYVLHFPLNEPVFDLPPGYTANSPALGIVNNIWHGLDVNGDWNGATGDVACFSSSPFIHSVSGNLVFDDTVAQNVDLSALLSVGGNVVITNNTNATWIDLSNLLDVGGDVTITGNGTPSSLRAGSPPSLPVDLTSLTSVAGDLNVSGNLQQAAISFGSLTVVDGDLTLDTLVTGALDLSAAAIFGTIEIDARGADSVAIATPEVAGATTAVAITRDRSSIAIDLPADTFSSSEVLSVANIDSSSSLPVGALDVAGRPVRLALLTAYALDVAGDPAFQQDATLTLELNVAALPAGLQAAVLAGLAEDGVALARRGDAPRGLYQALATCPPDTLPTVDGCAALTLLDAEHDPLPQGSPDPVAFVRFAALTDHLSDFAIALEVPAHGQLSAPALPGGTVGVPFTVSRNGSQMNLPVLIETSPAVIGRAWRATIDLEGVGRTALLVSTKGPAEGIFRQSGELLLQAPVLLLRNRDLSLPIPRDADLVGLAFSTQAAVLVESGWRLTNALDVTISGGK